MAAAFVPFFEKHTSSEALPQYQFSQFKFSKVTLTPAQTVRHVERAELKNKLVSDLRNALSLSLPADEIQQIVGELNKYRPSEKNLIEHLQNEQQDGDPSGSTTATDRPSIKLQKEGDKVTNIVVECECGQVIAMDCIY